MSVTVDTDRIIFAMAIVAIYLIDTFATSSANFGHINFGAIVNVDRTILASESSVALAIGFSARVFAFAILALVAIKFRQVCTSKLNES